MRHQLDNSLLLYMRSLVFGVDSETLYLLDRDYWSAIVSVKILPICPPVLDSWQQEGK